MKQQLSLSQELEYNSDLVTDNESDQYFTPPEVIERVTEFYGSIDLDPASCFEANKIVKANTYFSEEHNGLEQYWFGRVFNNPPYSTPKIGMFCQKAVDEYNSYRTKEIIMLLKEGATNKWFKPLRPFTTGYLDKRVSFINGLTGKRLTSPPSGHCMVYLGPRVRQFINHFSADGFAYFPNIKKGDY